MSPQTGRFSLCPNTWSGLHFFLLFFPLFPCESTKLPLIQKAESKFIIYPHLPLLSSYSMCQDQAPHLGYLRKSQSAESRTVLQMFESSGCQPRPFRARCRRLRRSPRRLGWCAWWCDPGLSLSRLTISWSLLPSTLGRKSDALSVLRVLKPRRGRPLPLMETYHCLLALARRLLLLPPPGDTGCSVEWWREA